MSMLTGCDVLEKEPLNSLYQEEVWRELGFINMYLNDICTTSTMGVNKKELRLFNSWICFIKVFQNGSYHAKMTYHHER